MRRHILLICLVPAGCAASEPAPGTTGGNTGPDMEVGSGPATSAGTSAGESPTSSAETTSADSASTGSGSPGSTSTGLPGMECVGADETLATAFLRVHPADFDWWTAPRGTPTLITFDCVPLPAAGRGVIDLICEDDTKRPTEQVRFEVINNLPALDLPISSILDQPEVASEIRNEMRQLMSEIQGSHAFNQIARFQQ